MPTPTYNCIATTTVSGTSTNSVLFDSIPSTYTDLVLVVNSSKTTGSVVNIYLRFNGDSGTNYSATAVYGTGSVAGSFRETTTIWGIAGNQTTGMSNTICHIMNYANTTTYKTFLRRNNVPDDSTSAGVALWRNTAAINQVEVLLTVSNFFTAGSILSLYGIKAEAV